MKIYLLIIIIQKRKIVGLWNILPELRPHLGEFGILYLYRFIRNAWDEHHFKYCVNIVN